jgi:hypothetical protein
MDVAGIQNKVATKYGLNPDQLEAGTFTKGQSTVLVGLFRTASHSQKDEDWEAYIEQKAKYLTGDKVSRNEV